MVVRGIKAARLPSVKNFDFDAIPMLNKILVFELARREFSRR